MEKDDCSGPWIEECLRSLGLTFLCDWDVLIFIYRHQASLISAEQIARLLGHQRQAVGDALNRLEFRGFIERSRPSQGFRFYQSALAEIHFAPASCLQRLLSLAKDRNGRLLLIKHLQQTPNLPVPGNRKTE